MRTKEEVCQAIASFQKTLGKSNREKECRLIVAALSWTLGEDADGDPALEEKREAFSRSLYRLRELLTESHKKMKLRKVVEVE